MGDYIGWAITLGANIYFFVKILRKGPGNVRDAIVGRAFTYPLLLILAPYSVYSFTNRDFVTGSACAIMVIIYCATVFITNRYLDRMRSVT